MTGAAARLPLPVFADGELAVLSPHLVAARFTRPKQVLSDAAWNGGWLAEATAVANHQMQANAFTSAAGRSRYCGELLARHRLPATAPLQLTAASVVLGGCHQRIEGGVRITIYVSAGVKANAVWAGDPASYDEQAEEEYVPMQLGGATTRGGVRCQAVNGSDPGKKRPRRALPAGTINAAVFVDARLMGPVFPHIFTVVAEAKADLLRASGVRSCYSHRFATGTGTDSTMVVADPLGGRGFASASTHSRLGMAIAGGMRTALAEALRGEGIPSEGSHD